MKKLLTGLLTSLTLCTPLVAHELKEEHYFSGVAMGCMKLGECTEGIYPVKSRHHSGETKEILEHLEDLEIKVYRADPKYFKDEYRGLYYSDHNKIFINNGFVKDQPSFLRILRHEGWHVAQDCMAGSLANSDIMSILEHTKIPEDIIQETFDRYGYGDPMVIRIEREAVMAMYKADMTRDALSVCNSDEKMWDVYFPPKKTWSYLYWNAWISK